MNLGSPVRSNYVRHGLELFAGYGEREALVGAGSRLTYTQLRVAVLELAAKLRQHGLRPGSSVLMMLANPIEAPIAQLALHLLGCRTMWVMPGLPQLEFNEYVGLLGEADALVYDARSHAETGRRLAAFVPAVPVFCFGPDGAGPDLLVGLSYRGEHSADAGAGSGSSVDGLVEALSLDGIDAEPESVFQTSGTTGPPKLVHHRNGFFAQAQALAVAYRDSALPSLRQYSISPFWAVSGQMTAFLVIFGGGLLVLEEKFAPETFASTIERERINSTFVSPAMFYELLDHPKVTAASLASLFMFNIGGAPASPVRLLSGIERFGPVLRIIYGLSESTMVTTQPGLTYDPEHPERLGSAGLPYGDVRIEIRGADGVRVLGSGEIGEVWVRSELNMAGYWREPELTARTLVDGWLRTGDIGYHDGDGYLYVVDRVQDVIITGLGARKVHARFVEDAIARHPQVRSVAVIGVPDEKLGHVVHAFVVPVEPGKITEEEVRDLVSLDVDVNAVPRTVQVVSSLPMTRSGKVDKKALREWQRTGAIPSDHSADGDT